MVKGWATVMRSERDWVKETGKGRGKVKAMDWDSEKETVKDWETDWDLVAGEGCSR